jgi:hypothetical protein
LGGNAKGGLELMMLLAFLSFPSYACEFAGNNGSAAEGAIPMQSTSSRRLLLLARTNATQLGG